MLISDLVNTSSIIILLESTSANIYIYIYIYIYMKMYRYEKKTLGLQGMSLFVEKKVL